MNRFIVSILIYFFITSCQTAPHSAPRNTISLLEVEALSLDSNQKAIEQHFSKPEEITSVYNSNTEVAWIYFDNHARKRVVFIINKESEKLVAKTWIVHGGDAEQNIENTLKRYPSARYKKRELKWLNPHIAPDEAFYEDESLGLSIKIRKQRNEVSYINWTHPGAKREEQDGKCIKFQKENGLIGCKNYIGY